MSERKRWHDELPKEGESFEEYWARVERLREAEEPKLPGLIMTGLVIVYAVVVVLALVRFFGAWL